MGRAHGAQRLDGDAAAAGLGGRRRLRRALRGGLCGGAGQAGAWARGYWRCSHRLFAVFSLSESTIMRQNDLMWVLYVARSATAGLAASPRPARRGKRRRQGAGGQGRRRRRPGPGQPEGPGLCGAPRGPRRRRRTGARSAASQRSLPRPRAGAASMAVAGGTAAIQGQRRGAPRPRPGGRRPPSAYQTQASRRRTQSATALGRRRRRASARRPGWRGWAGTCSCTGRPRPRRSARRSLPARTGVVLAAVWSARLEGVGPASTRRAISELPQP